QAPTREAAVEEATALRNLYLQTDPDTAVALDVQIAQLLQDAAAVDAAIAELEPVLSPEEQSLLAQQQSIEATILGVQDRLRAIVIDLAAANTAEARTALTTERANLSSELAELTSDRAALGPTPVAELSSEDALRLQALTAQKELIAAEYQRVYLRQQGLSGGGVSEIPTSMEFASEPIAPWILAVAGMVGGALIALLGLLVISRTRRIVWLAEDIDVPVLGVIPARSVEARGNVAWYDAAEGGQRKTAVQALRSAVQAHAHTGSTIALTGHNTGSADVQALAADLAGSMATAGDSVLLIDANFDSRTALGEYRVGGMALSEVLRLSPDAPEFAASVQVAVEQAYVVRPGLAVIPSGPPPGSAADALAGRQYRALIEAAESYYDTTIVVVDDFGTPSAQAAMQRVRHGILVTTPGATTEADVNGLIEDADRLRISVVGAVFLGRRGRLSGLFRKTEKEPAKSKSSGSVSYPAAAPREDTTLASPMNRLSSYAIPDERRSAAVQHSPLGDLATNFGLSKPDNENGGLGSELLAAMTDASSEKAFEAVSDYVVSRAEDMVTARYGYGDLLEALIHDVSEYGFLSLRPVKRHRTVGSWLTEEIEREVEWNSGAELVGQVERLISGDQPEVGIDDWLDREFFTRHLERTDGQPEVWHLVSPERAVSLLLPARRLNAEKLEGVVTEVVSGAVDELERKRKAAVTRSDLEAAAVYEQQIDDVRVFEKNLRKVLYGNRGNGKRVRSVAWNPDWSDGTRANLAPFQAEGLLPFEVLSEEEISELLRTA
ncbi:MAG TPA: hypothetical protein VFT85_02145, partial [Acidimicrobiia bacterium]|nr:hypothetical protein [Acidimicrobiia bacterium]